MGNGAVGLAAHPVHPVLGSQLLPYTEGPGQAYGYMSVQSEVTRALEDPSDFRDVSRGSPNWRRKTSGLLRDTPTDSRAAFVVDDGDYVSARWPGDTHTFATVLSQKLTAAR